MRESRRIFRFVVIGTLNALIIAAVIWLMMDELDIDYMLSNITAYVIAQTHNFIWCKHWIFPLDDKETMGIFLSPEPLGVTKEQIMCETGTLGIPEFGTKFTLQMLADTLNCDEYLAQFLGLFIYGGVNFIMNRKITFR